MRELKEVLEPTAGPDQAQPAATATNGSRYNLTPFATPENRWS